MLFVSTTVAMHMTLATGWQGTIYSLMSHMWLPMDLKESHDFNILSPDVSMMLCAGRELKLLLSII